ncbi:MAG: bifunctional 5,10-methylenetetrahydrofolate dehydrogenase/5,10-methenyltetrahydrofolate cyclohydrolase [Patescibacteria group bacterium]
MKIPCRVITAEVNEKTKARLKDIYKKGIKPHIALFYVGQDPLTDIFIAHKRAAAEALGMKLSVFRYEKTPMFETFAKELRRVSINKDYHAVIIQRPLPAELRSPTIDEFIPLVKEVESQKYKSPYVSPVGLSTLSILKYVHSDFKKWAVGKAEAEFFKRNFKKKFVVLAGRGETTGQPIANTLVRYKMALVITHSETPDPSIFYKQADIIITTTGHKILTPENIKPGAILINFGYGRVDNKTCGDYSDAEVDGVAGFYTPTIGGTGPLMIAYLMRNVVEAYARQAK